MMLFDNASTIPRPQYHKKSIRSFALRTGRMTEGQRQAFEKYWPIYGMDLFAGTIDMEQLFERKAPTVLEIGFGMGDSLYQMASNEPDKNFIGIEVHTPGVGRLIANAGKSELKNLRVYLADAKDVLAECIPDGSIDRLQIYFPDPWHKKKHHKRRLVQPEFIQFLCSKLTADGIIHMATDWENYAEQMLEVCSAEPQLTSTETGFIPRPEWRPETKFERRGARLGHGVWDLIFRNQTG